MTRGLLDVLDAETRRAVRRTAVRRRFARGEVVFHQGDPGDALHVVSTGTLEVLHEIERGRQTTVRLLRPGDHFGELALIGERRRRTSTVRALERAETLVLTGEVFGRLRASWPAVEALLVAALAERVEDLTDQLAEALWLPADKRVYRRLVLLDRRRQALRSDDDLRLSQDELARLAGTTRPTVNRALRRAVDARAVELRRGRIRVVDRGLIERWGRG